MNASAPRAGRRGVPLDLAQVWRDTKRKLVQRGIAPPTLMVHEASDEFRPRQRHGTAAQSCTIALSSDTSLAAAQRIAACGVKPLVLNFASPNLPGGAVASGVNAQEEALFRCTSISLALDPEGPHPRCYPIIPGRCVVALNVQIVKSDEYALLPEPFTEIDIAVCPAQQKPATDGLRYVDPTFMQAKVSALMQAAVAAGSRALVLGAWGCGGFRNPPLGLAEIFREQLLTQGFGRCFDYVEFAVPAAKHHEHFLAAMEDVLSEIWDPSNAPLLSPGDDKSVSAVVIADISAAATDGESPSTGAC